MDVDGARLRELREEHDASLGDVARRSGLSLGHLSRVERGERLVTPAVVLAYQRALGVDLAGGVNLKARPGSKDDPMKRRDFMASVTAVAAGAPLTEPVADLLRGLHAPAPARVGLSDVLQVEQATRMSTSWDLQFGGGSAAEMSKAALRWAVRLLDQRMTTPVRAQMLTAVGALADRTAWTAFDAGNPEGARHVFKLALHAAVEADDPDLKAHTIGDLAVQLIETSHPRDALALISFGEGRTTATISARRQACRAHAHAACGDVEATRRHLGAFEDAIDIADDPPWWTTQVVDDSYLHTARGHVMFVLAERTADRRAIDDARVHFARAAALLGADRGRGVARCNMRLAVLHLDFPEGDLAAGSAATRRAVSAARGVRSARVASDLRRLRAAAAKHTDLADLLPEIDTLLVA